mgnify:CR=1 FL=1|jgi:pyruvate/2-oxoglutarate dehydrogenase complex dihydrolipoamide dehydrogenase (E3) component/uncharacterized membrane protein YdjX (TVP38/TMEM64 family)
MGIVGAYSRLEIKMVMKKKLLLVVIALAVVAFFYLDLQQYLSFEYLQSAQGSLVDLRTGYPVLISVAFFLTYVVVAALSLPGAAIMTLAAGAIFGIVWGFLIVSFASTLGASCAFVGSRYLFRDAVQDRFGDRLTAFNQGVEKNGKIYLASLRLMPGVPFFVINILMGLTPIRLLTFYWVSQLCMIPGTLIYINAGKQIASLQSPSDILSPGILFAFALAAFFPLIAKKIASFIRTQKKYAKWTRPKKFDRNLIVIGAGAGGLVSAYIAAAVKAEVTLIEANKMGGDCLNTGCVPSKALIRSAKLRQQMMQAEKYGLSNQEVPVNFRQIMQRVNKVIADIEPHDSVERYTGLGVDVVQGYATIKDPWTVEIAKNDGSTECLSAPNIVVASGAEPFVPPLEGIESSGYLTSDTLWERLAEMETPPQRLVILGGGPIGCELAQSLSRLGSEVTQIEMLPQIMVREDAEVAALVRERLEQEGVRVLTDHKALRTETGAHGEKQIVIEHQGQELAIDYDELIVAVGRRARLTGYGLESLGIETNKPLEVNDFLQTSFPNIYVAGDVAGSYQFTHTAAHQAWYAAVNALFGQFKRFRVDYSVIPWTTFTDPEVARVGISENEAQDQGIAYEVSRFDIGELDRAIADSSAHGFIKVLTVPNKDKILGVVIVGEHAGDLLAEFVLAMKYKLGLNKVLGTMHSYPTLAEANKYVAGEWKRAHAPEGILNWLGKYHKWRIK